MKRHSKHEISVSSLLSGSSWSFRASGFGWPARYCGSAGTARRERIPWSAWTFCKFHSRSIKTHARTNYKQSDCEPVRSDSLFMFHGSLSFKQQPPAQAVLISVAVRVTFLALGLSIAGCYSDSSKFHFKSQLLLLELLPYIVTTGRFAV